MHSQTLSQTSLAKVYHCLTAKFITMDCHQNFCSKYHNKSFKIYQMFFEMKNPLNQLIYFMVIELNKSLRTWTNTWTEKIQEIRRIYSKYLEEHNKHVRLLWDHKFSTFVTQYIILCHQDYQV